MCLQWNLPEGLNADGGPTEVEIAPRSETKIGLNVRLVRDRGAFGEAYLIALEYELAGTGWRGRIDVPILWGGVRLPRGDYGKGPLFALDQQRQVTNLVEHDPHATHLLWRGKSDLSAKVWACRAAGELRLRIAVTDDQAHYEASAPAQGDAVRITLDLPGSRGLWILQASQVQGRPRLQALQKTEGADDDMTGARLTVRPADGRGDCVYELALPDAASGLKEANMAEGIGLNVQVRDNDGRGLKGWIELVPGAAPQAGPTPLPRLLP